MNSGTRIASAMALFLLLGCSEAVFSGGSDKRPEEKAPETPDPEPESDPRPTTSQGKEQSPSPKLMPTPPSPKGDNVVTQGSFSAWTVPSKPRPNETYEINIEVRLSGDTNGYTLADLSGEVIGTDGYHQPISDAPSATVGYGDDSMTVDPSTYTQFSLEDGKARVVIQVPCGDTLVSDTVDVESKRLKEHQRLKIVFK